MRGKERKGGRKKKKRKALGKEDKEEGVCVRGRARGGKARRDHIRE